MKQGKMINYSLNKNKLENNISCFKNVRKPCKIEERIRIRRLNNIDSGGVKSEPKNAVRKNSSGSSSPDTLNSCSSNSSEFLPRVRGSKERVDLLEIGIIDYEDHRARIKRTKSRLKSGQKLCRRIRPRSAPSSSRFFGSECVDRDSFCWNEGTEEVSDFVDCKIIERECIVPDLSKDIPDDLEPLGNPALISLMKESIDKLQAAEIKAKKSIEDILNENLVNNEILRDKSSAIFETGINHDEEKDKENQSFNAFGATETAEAGKVLPISVPGGGVAKDIGKCRRYETDLKVSAVVKIPENIYEPRKRCGCKSWDSQSMRKSNTVFKYAESFNGSVGWTAKRSRDFAETNGTRNSEKKLNGSIVRSCCCNRSDDPLESRCRFETRDRRSSSSPRRKVTFRLPSLVIPEEEEEEEKEDDKDNYEDDEEMTKRKNFTPDKIFGCLRNKYKKLEKGEGEKYASMKSDTMTLISTCCCCNIHRAQFRRNRGYHRCWRCLKNFEKHDKYDNRKYFIPKKGVNFCKEIITKHQDIIGDDLKNSESKISVTSANDWAVYNNDDHFDCSGIRNNVYFPKETRRAMNVLLQNKDNRTKEYNPSTRITVVEELQHGKKIQRNDQQHQKQHQQQQQQQQRFFREVNVLKKPDLEIFNIEEGKNKAMHVATYAQALAVFQKRCDPLAGGSCKKKRHVAWKEGDGAEGSTSNDKRRTRDIKYLNFLRNLRYPESEIRTFCGAGRNTGFNMQTNNGSDNGSSENGIDRTGWTVGLINGRFKYLTAETFGFKINANGASLKKKQLWTLEGSEHQVFLRSHLDRYLAVDQFGNVTCEAEDTADPGCAFQIQVASDGSGRWALKNIQRGYFLGSSQDELKCTAKVPGDAEYWLVHLAARPQVNLRSAGRKRFAHLSAAQDEIHVDAPVPWGEDTLFTLEFRPAAMPDADSNGDARREVRSEAGIGGHYALHTCNNKYLARDGKLLDSCTRDCLYAAEFHAGMLALRDVSGAYLAPIGSKAVLKSRSNTVTRDELFSLEDSLPQASFVAALNQRYVSVKQGVDVTANQDEISGHETFQLEFDRATKRWYLRTMQDRYWTLEAGGGIQASDHKRSSNALFDLVWQPVDGTVALRANNGKFLATKRSGHLYANADSPGESEASKFYFYLMNRPVLVLRCEQGFVGLKSNASPKLECNKASYETIRVERCDRGIVRFKGQNGKYWHADSEGVTSDADVPSDGFYLELREPSRICIKSTDGRYLSAGKNGVFRLGDTEYESATKWEF